MQTKSFLGLNPQGFHRVVYDEWGDPAAKNVLVCVHGLTRNAFDFKWLAEAMPHDWRVVAPDIVGRARSDWLRDAARYTYPQYMADLNALMARLDTPNVFWMGTSMGGLLGMMLASLPQTPIKGLALNDIGPFVPAAGLKRLMKYVPKTHFFKEFTEVLHFLKSNLQGYDGLSAMQWQEVARQSVFWDEVTQTWQMRYDPQVASTLKPDDIKDQDFWRHWEALRCPVLALHGANSDILNGDTAQQMALRHQTKVVTFADQGHALSLGTTAQIDLIKNWLIDQAKTNPS